MSKHFSSKSFATLQRQHNVLTNKWNELAIETMTNDHGLMSIRIKPTGYDELAFITSPLQHNTFTPVSFELTKLTVFGQSPLRSVFGRISNDMRRAANSITKGTCAMSGLRLGIDVGNLCYMTAFSSQLSVLHVGIR